ncbi:Predicted protein [Taphrina deformans PYCC 5710]|uniref:Acyltransferase 3 domain-containing protein n=1 Tax=Taphrina deformans (strain PYCC 5710 / ATCC 11124 / CBS 356.35 / IMI 108563 / JCM 9778 / NBRC 8474) TaxID=1097556 RepID=R4XBV5_TAPDE|nr:Predicted protein [Taphrina deformans PYCC 5710]|eukprot:CCG83050.1 Predicted protein [Taphrina deformans PYCC 5710]
MAIDHTFFYSGKEHPTESFKIHPDRHSAYLDSWYLYGLRFVTHTCAPGFTMLMGLGLVYFIDSRVGKSGWTLTKTAKYITIRGLIFFVFAAISFLPFALMFHLRAYLIFDIISALGVDFIIGGMFVLLIKRFEGPRLLDSVTAAIGILSVALACLTIVLSQFPDSVLVQILWLTGGDETTFYLSRFPPLSWLPVVMYGVFYGRLTQKFPRRTASMSFCLCIILFLSFLAVRLPGSWGNLTPVKSSWFRKGVKEFFWTNKYCPDLAYIALFTSINHLFITIFALLPRDFPGISIPRTSFKLDTNRVLLDIGTSPFAFYFVHMYTLAGIGAFLNAVHWVWSPEQLGPGYVKSGLGNGWLYWMVYALVIGWMWFVCRNYGRFKSSQAVESVWRYF